jgi:hypothetical protein
LFKTIDEIFDKAKHWIELFFWLLINWIE